MVSYFTASSEELFDSLVSNSSPDEKPTKPMILSSGEDSPVKPAAKKG